MSYAVTQRVHIVAHHLVQVAGKVINSRVPHAIRIVNQNKACCVFKRAEDVVFLAVIVGKHDFIAWHQGSYT